MKQPISAITNAYRQISQVNEVSSLLEFMKMDEILDMSMATRDLS
jgi:hypothetical protein